MMRRDLISTPPGPQPRRLRFTVDHYYKMIELEMIDNYEKSEIIDGEMVQKMTIGDRRAMAVNRLNVLFVKQLSDNFLIGVKNPLRMGEYDEPEPDFVIARLTKNDVDRHPQPDEAVLVVEVADSSLKYDRDTKLPLYAEGGIEEVWIVNLRSDVIEVHQDPNFGIYQITKIFKSGELVQSSVLPELAVAVKDVLNL